MSSSTVPEAPAGMSGLAVEPWSKGDWYAVAADWAQASSAVLTLGEDGWVSMGRQVGDFGHSPRLALAEHLRGVITAGGEDAEDESIESLVAKAKAI